MVKAVYDASQTLTTDQTNMALYWRDIPGVTAGGHWLSILQEVLKQTNSRLDKAALAYAVTGTCLAMLLSVAGKQNIIIILYARSLT